MWAVWAAWSVWAYTSCWCYYDGRQRGSDGGRQRSGVVFAPLSDGGCLQKGLRRRSDIVGVDERNIALVDGV